MSEINDCEFIVETGDAKHIDRPDKSADVVLLMEPLYHLQNSEDRAAALNEAYRVLKDGGLLKVLNILFEKVLDNNQFSQKCKP